MKILHLFIAVIFSTSSLISPSACSMQLEIRCKQFSLDFWGFVNNILTCADNPSTLEVAKSDTKFKKIVHNDGSEITNSAEVEGFYIDGAKKLKYMPHGVTCIFPNVKAIAIWNSGLSCVSKEDLKEFGTNLIHAGFWNSEIQMLDADLFDHNPNLKMIRFDGNPLKYIDSTFFVNLKNSEIVEARFENANCINQDLKSNGVVNIQDFKWNDGNCHHDQAKEWVKKKSREVLENKLGKFEASLILKKISINSEDFQSVSLIQESSQKLLMDKMMEINKKCDERIKIVETSVENMRRLLLK